MSYYYKKNFLIHTQNTNSWNLSFFVVVFLPLVRKITTQEQGISCVYFYLCYSLSFWQQNKRNIGYQYYFLYRPSKIKRAKVIGNNYIAPVFARLPTWYLVGALLLTKSLVSLKWLDFWSVWFESAAWFRIKQKTGLSNIQLWEKRQH